MLQYIDQKTSIGQALEMDIPSLLVHGLLAVFVFFCLAPGYDAVALLCVAGAGLAWFVGRFPLSRREWVFLTAFSLLGAYYFIHRPQMGQWTLGFAITCVVSYYIFSTYRKTDFHFIPLILFVPLLGYLLIAYVNIIQHLFTFHGKDFTHTLEAAKRSLKVGVKYQGIALQMLIPLLVYFHFNTKKSFKNITKVLLVLGVAQLGIIDNRASLAILVLLGLVFVGFLNRKAIENFRDRFLNTRNVILTFLIIGLFGWTYGHRLGILIPSTAAALDYSYHPSWYNLNDFRSEFCIADNVECVIDASVFYRLAWLIFGFKFLVSHPWGIGPSGDTLLEKSIRISGVKGEVLVSGEFHNDFLNFGVTHGIPRLLLLVSVFMIPLILFTKNKEKFFDSNFYSLLIVVFLGFMIRFFFDSVGGDGIWYFIAFLVGMMLGLYRNVTYVAHS
jgi:hypothetical protein